ncbi:MAG: HEPN domain-containing protein [Acetobacteraceae bacterium]|nr:HEPN domain-containing protein [Acetobacteraceae bacterium]
MGEHLDKARECLTRAKIILDAGVGEDAGRNAYLAAFRAAQALILARSGKVVKTHRGVHRLFTQLAKNDARLREFPRFLSQAYNLKDIADYELGSSASVPLDRAGDAINTAERFVGMVAGIVARDSD